MAGIVEAAFTGIGALSQAKTSLWDLFTNTIAASNDMKKIHEFLNRVLTKLCSIKADHEGKLQRERATHVPSKAYDNWIQDVTRIEDKIEKINEKYKSKCKKSKVKIYTRSKFSEQMKENIADLFKLIEESTKLGDLLVPKKHEKVVEMITTSIENFPTLQKELDEILNCLTMKKVKGIRVHGMMGIGKTTILENLNNHKKVAGMFDLVIWVKVSTEENKKNFTTDEIQEAMIRRLKLNVESTIGCDEVARRIRAELSDKKFLLLLDGVKEDLDLDEIGISPNYKIGSKIVLTTRFGHVCPLIVDINIKVGRLSEKEAEKMFRTVLNQSKHKVGRIMRQVVKRCDGLPFAIKMVASAFKMRDTEEKWSDGLFKLKQWPDKQDTAMKEMCRLLDFCCDCLEGSKRDCFLYTALYPEDSDIHIDCILDCWEAEEFYNFAPDSDPKMARANGRNVLDDLKMVSLLEEGVGTDYVRMHKLIRQVALCKLSDNNLVKTNESLKVAPSVELWKQKKWVSLVDNNLETLPEGLECSMLSTLFLQKNLTLKKLPSLFFNNMGNLRVLSLSNTGIASLPSSLLALRLLKVLYLNGCTDLAELRSDEILKLLNLEVLDIRGSGVKNIAANIENLEHLRRLLVSFNICGDERGTQKVISDVISKISPTLEELVVEVNTHKQSCNKMINFVRDKVSARLENLTTLKFRFEDGMEDVIKVVAGTPITYYPMADDLTSFVVKINGSRSSGSFQLFIGCSISSSPQIPKLWPYNSYLKYCNGKGFNPNITDVLSKTDAFELANHDELEHISQFELSSLRGVRGFLIESCANVTEFIDGKYMVDEPILSNLLRLYIKNLPKLKSVWNVPIDLRSLSSLRTLKIGECSVVEELIIDHRTTAVLPNLRKLVVYNMPNLVKICANLSLEWPALEKLKIQGCPNLNELPFGKDNAVKLRKLVLLDLPNLTRICACESFEWHALETLKIHGCPNLKKLPFNGCNAKKLRYIEAEEEWWQVLNWQDPKIEELLQPYCSLW